MIEDIRAYIENHREEMIATLKKLIETPSPDGGETLAQEVVKEKLEVLGFETETFRIDERVKECTDYCDPDIAYHPGAYNLYAIKKTNDSKRSLLLFGHIDTESEDHFGKGLEPYKALKEDGRIYGLGAADDKGGIAMILEAIKTALALDRDLPYDLKVLSLLGKHGGAFGTLSAMAKGYKADDYLYVHPAETGHGFEEIKNISLGVLDLKLTILGEKGIAHDDLSVGINANVLMGKAINILDEWNQNKRKENVFDFGSTKTRSATSKRHSLLSITS